MSVVLTLAIEKMMDLDCRTKIIQGGTSAGKTFGIIPLLISKALEKPKCEISIVSESFPHLRRGAMKDFIKIMELMRIWDDTRFNRSNAKYSFANGSYIEFFSADQESRLRGARRDILYVNEANNINFEAYYQLAIRTNDEIWIDFNPTSEFWAHTEVQPDADAELLILTYKDNDALSESIVKEIEKAKEKAKTNPYWENWWQVYGLGQIGSLQGAVLNDWSTCKEIPEDAEYVGSGMDFGYTNDPTTLIDVWKYEGSYYFDEIIYRTGLNNQQIGTLCGMNGLRRNIFADSAEPKSIDAIYDMGVSIRGAVKGRDSIIYGLDLLQQEPFYVTERSTNIIKELRNYLWATDKSGKTLNKPIDIFNHAIDAMRYWATMVIGKRTKADIR